MKDGKFICLDIGGTKILGAVFDRKGKILFREKKKTKAENGRDQIEERIIYVIDRLIEDSKTGGNDIVAISAGAPGVIDSQEAIIKYAPNLPWKDYDIGAVMRERFGVPFYIGNDVNTGMYGEFRFGAAKGVKNAVGLFIGTGLGGGLVINGKIYTGSGYAGAELGHMCLDPEGPYCNCGLRGCLEAYVSKIAMMKEIRRQLEAGRQSVLSELIDMHREVFKSKYLRQALDEEDGLALEILERTVYYLACGAGSLASIFNPDVLVLGGGVMEAAGDYILPRFGESIKRFSWSECTEGMKITQAQLGDDSILYGALAVILDRMEDGT